MCGCRVLWLIRRRGGSRSCGRIDGLGRVSCIPFRRRPNERMGERPRGRELSCPASLLICMTHILYATKPNQDPSQPCWLSDVRCGEVCGKRLKCGLHLCRKPCHRAGECEDSDGQPCQQLCGKVKKVCGHTDVENTCHAPFSCKEETACQSKICCMFGGPGLDMFWNASHANSDSKLLSENSGGLRLEKPGSHSRAAAASKI